MTIVNRHALAGKGPALQFVGLIELRDTHDLFLGAANASDGTRCAQYSRRRMFSPIRAPSRLAHPL